MKGELSAVDSNLEGGVIVKTGESILYHVIDMFLVSLDWKPVASVYKTTA